MTDYTFTRGRQGHEHGAAGQNNTPALRDYDVQVQTALTSIGTHRDTDVAAVTVLQGYGLHPFAKGITAEDTSTGATAGTTETAFTNQVAMPASTLAAGDRIHIKAKVKATGANSTDQLALKLVAANNADLKTTAVTLAAVASADSTANDEFWLECDLRVKAIGAASTATVNGAGKAIKAGGATWQNVTTIDDLTTLATTSILYFGVTYTYNVSNAGNTSVIKECFVTVTRPSA